MHWVSGLLESIQLSRVRSLRVSNHCGMSRCSVIPSRALWQQLDIPRLSHKCGGVLKYNSLQSNITKTAESPQPGELIHLYALALQLQ